MNLREQKHHILIQRQFGISQKTPDFAKITSNLGDFYANQQDIEHKSKLLSSRADVFSAWRSPRPRGFPWLSRPLRTGGDCFGWYLAMTSFSISS